MLDSTLFILFRLLWLVEMELEVGGVCLGSGFEAKRALHFG
jgi:hypothetical protein